jgi:hypothetical protein
MLVISIFLGVTLCLLCALLCCFERVCAFADSIASALQRLCSSILPGWLQARVGNLSGKLFALDGQPTHVLQVSAEPELPVQRCRGPCLHAGCSQASRQLSRASFNTAGGICPITWSLVRTLRHVCVWTPGFPQSIHNRFTHVSGVHFLQVFFSHFK